MNRLYPRTKWSDTVSSDDQLEIIAEEVEEIGEALVAGESHERIDEEIADLEHAIQTYWDCREREGADVEEIRRKVMWKNNNLGCNPNCIRWM